MRVQYLLDAYRRLERAQNRDMTREVADELEAALADIQLLGSPRQVELAVAFIKEFAEKRNASAEELMQDLRRSLRQELLLDPVPPARMWPRIEPDQLTSTDTSAVWLSALAMTEQSTHELAKRLAPPTSNGSAPSEVPDAFVEEMQALMAQASPSAVVVASNERLSSALYALLTASSVPDIRGLNTAQLGERAFQAHLIDAKLFDSIKGLSVMSLLAAMDQDDLDPKKADEFAVYTAATLYAIEHATSSASR
jgi:hypothetical protein